MKTSHTPHRTGTRGWFLWQTDRVGGSRGVAMQRPSAMRMAAALSVPFIAFFALAGIGFAQDPAGAVRDEAPVLHASFPGLLVPFDGDSESGVCPEGDLDCDEDILPDADPLPLDTPSPVSDVAPPDPFAPVEPPVAAPRAQAVHVHYFWSRGCPHCVRASRFLEDLEARTPNTVLHRYEVGQERINAVRLEEALRLASMPFQGVPVTVIGNILWTGFDDTKAAAMEEQVRTCADAPCGNPLGAHFARVVDGDGALDRDAAHALTPVAEDDRPFVEIPFFGRVDAAAISLPVFTVVIAGLDGFNPCAFFVLLFLLSMLIHTRSRARMLLVGGLFVGTSAVAYFVFMAAWLNLFLVIGEVALVTSIAGVVALALGGVNVKDYFFWKKGVSLQISETHKVKLFDRMRRLLNADSLVSLIVGTMVLAITANMYELLCTAGFPMVFTRVLTMHELSGGRYYGYLVLYNLIYVVPLAVIVGIFVASMGRRKLSESEGRALKLISGLMMLAMGGILLFYPEALSNVLAAVGIIAGVAVLSAGILFAQKHRRRAAGADRSGS